MTTAEKLDIIVYGATGYTGKLVCEYLQTKYGNDGEVRWGIAGRNKDKLQAVVDQFGLGDIPVMIADSDDTDSLDAMASACRVVLNTAGPYMKYGSTVVESCARLGTDHVDLNGEPLWMNEVLTQYEDAARESGARIVFSCGFDSIPTDLGVQFLQEHAVKRFGKPFPRVKGRVKALLGAGSGGSLASFKVTRETVKANPELFALLTNPFALTPGFEGPQQPDGNDTIYEEDLGSSSGPFIMATINTKNLHRSNFLLGHPYGEDFVYDEMALIDENESEARERNGFGFHPDLKPGDGPSKEQRESGFYEIWYVGSNDTGDSLTVIVTGDQDPGYGSTSKMVAEAAICLARKPKENDGGILTPASAMGAALRKRIEANAGVTFTLSESLPTASTVG